MRDPSRQQSGVQGTKGSQAITGLNNDIVRTMKTRGVDFVMYQVSDLARAASFYRQVLGLPQEVYSDEGQWAELDRKSVV